MQSSYLDKNQESQWGEIRLNPVQWWFKLTSIPEPAAGASFVKREAARKSRLASIIASFLLILFCIYFPADIVSRSIPSLISTTAILPVALSAILLNRAGRTFWAGMVIVCAAELALSSLVWTARPLDVVNLQLYELLVIGELLAVSLLPGRVVFLAALYNATVITCSLLYLPKTPALTQLVQQQFVTLLLFPVGVQFLVAGVTFLWVSSTLRAISRADRAEVVASLERQVAQQATIAAEEKRQLEEKINQIVQYHIDAMKSNSTPKIPFAEETKVLWPLINVIHSLYRRLHTSQQTEYELIRLKRAVVDYTNFVYSTDLAQYEKWPQTRTDLDSLLYAFKQQKRIFTAPQQSVMKKTHLAPMKLPEPR
jgi:hypothetical protein